MAKPLSPFALLDKQAVLGCLEATGSHDPDVLERGRAELLGIARTSWVAGAVLMFTGASVCFSPLGIPGGLPFVALAAWLIQRAKRSADAIREGFAEYGKQPLD